MDQLSPTKARLAAQSTTDWSSVLTFLSSLYSSTPIPPFERNNQTLHILLSLSAQNEAADETHEILTRARREELGRVKARGEGNGEDEGDIRGEILRTIESGLDEAGRSALDELASTSTILRLPSCNGFGVSVDNIARSIIDLTKEEAAHSQRVKRVTDLQVQLDREITSLQSQLDELRSYNAESAPATDALQRQTVEWNRSTKVLAIKIGEYTDRLGPLEERVVALEGPKIEELVESEKELQKMRGVVEELEGRVGAYNGVPVEGGLKGAREKYESLLAELGQMERRRDQLFENLVES